MEGWFAELHALPCLKFLYEESKQQCTWTYLSLKILAEVTGM